MPTKQVTKSRYQTRNDDKVFSEEERAAVQPLARIVRTSAFTASPSRITVASGPDPKTQTLVRPRTIGDVTR